MQKFLAGSGKPETTNLTSIAMSYVNKVNSEFRTADVAYGRLACAKVVTTILKAAGLIDRIMINVDETVKKLQNEGWIGVSDPMPGDIVVWGKTDKLPYAHIGIVIGDNKAINNSSVELMPVITSIKNEGRPVDFYLSKRRPEIRDIIFTSYNPVYEQTDGSPCIGASGQDQCALANRGVRIIALSQDLVGRTGKKAFTYGDRVWLNSDSGDGRCSGEFVVLDTMNERYKNRGDLFMMTRDQNTSCIATIYKIS